MEKEMIKVTEPSGEVRDAEVVLCFESDDTKKKYVIYTFNELDENGMIALYSSTVDEETKELKNIETEEEWAMVKETMKKIIVDWKE